MDIQELKTKFKVLPIWGRALVGIGLGLIVPIYYYFDQADDYQHRFDESGAAVAAARDKFEKAKAKHDNTPKLEEKLAYTEEQLAKAKKRLPDAIRVEDILEKVAVIAKETGVQLNTFKPGDEVVHRGDVQYIEMPYSMELGGRFNQITTFFDRIAHLELIAFMRDISLTPVGAAQGAQAAVRDPTTSGRPQTQLNVNYTLVVYRGASEAELNTPSAAPGAPGAARPPGAAPPGGPPPAAGAPAANNPPPPPAAAGPQPPARAGERHAEAIKTPGSTSAKTW